MDCPPTHQWYGTLFHGINFACPPQEVCSTGNTLPDPVSVSLPSNEAELEALEGMLVSIKSPVVTDNYNADSYGQITVAAERQWQFTQAI